MKKIVFVILFTTLGAIALFAFNANGKTPIPPVANVDLPRFMGDWYVIAHIPSRPEREAFDAVERYAARPDGRIQTTFTYRKGSFQAPLESMHPIGTVDAEGNGAVWGMQFIWPIKAEYLVAHVDEDYTETIIARSRLDYVWVMARTPQIPAEDFERLRRQVADLGYDVNKLQKVPQRW